jgi:hypothetical protein
MAFLLKARPAQFPAHKSVIRQNGDTIHYVYADPLVCDCLYVGTQQACDQYRMNQLSQHLADERQLAALAWYAAAWSWAAGGPWEPVDASFGFGPIGW